MPTPRRGICSARGNTVALAEPDPSMPHAAAFLLSCGAAPRAAGPAFLRAVIQGLPCERRLALPVAAAADSLNRNFFICGPRAALEAAGDARHQSSATHPSVRSVQPAASSLSCGVLS